MHVVERVTAYRSKSWVCRLYVITDVQWGDWTCDEALFRQDLAEVAADEDGYVLLNGDLIQAIGPRDRRYSPASMAPRLRGKDNPTQVQAWEMQDLLKPIAHKIIAMTTGNHEAASAKWNNYDPYQEIARYLAEVRGDSVADFTLGYGGMLNWTFRRQPGGHAWVFKARVHHGYGSNGVGLPGNIALKLGRELDRHACHLVILGHLHQGLAVKKVYVEPGRNKSVKRMERKAFMVPSYQRTHVGPDNARDEDGFPVVSWSESMGHSELPTGMLRILIEPDRERFWGLF